MKYFKELEELNYYYLCLYQQRAEGIDYLSNSFYKKMDKVIRKDFKKSLKLYKRQDKISYRLIKRKIKKPSLFSNFLNIFKKIKNKIKQSKSKEEKTK